MTSISSLAKIIEKFDRQMGVLLQDICTLTENTDVYKTTSDVKRMYNMRHLLAGNDFLIKKFSTHVYETYKDDIMSKNSDFFLQSDLNDADIDDIQDYSVGDIKNIITILRNIWSDITDETREKLWLRMQLLTRLCGLWSENSR